MANKTQLGIGAVIAVLVAAYFGSDLNQARDESTQQEKTQYSTQQNNHTESKYSENQNYSNNQPNTQLDQPSHHSQIESGKSSQNRHGLEVIRKAFDSKLSNVQVQSVGHVKALLRDDNAGLRHQKFILALDNGLTVLVAHNIDLSPRIDNLKKGDTVEFFGEYEYSNQGGVIHWTHHDPQKRHEDGWLKHNGKTYS